MASDSNRPALIPLPLILPFVLVTTLFALWGFANDVTNPLVKAFKDIFVISNAQSSLVQTAFYGGYATMAIPAALFIYRFSYKAGILLGLALYAVGALLAFPAAQVRDFNLFLVALYVLTFGLAFLETTANPYILSMGPAETATLRLNLAQAFNPIGSLTGMTVASLFILSSLQVEEIRSETQAHADPAAAVEVTVDPVLAAHLNANPKAGFDQVMIDYKAGDLASHQGRDFGAMQDHDLGIVKLPYVVIGLVVIGVFFVFLFTKMPDTQHAERGGARLGEVAGKVLRNKLYLGGVVAQTAYVGAQIMCWTFIIHYATENLGMSAATAQNHNIAAMAIFCSSRFICTFFLKFVSAPVLLLVLSIGAFAATAGAIFLEGHAGLYSLIAVSACMSLMFPTIYGLALGGMGEEAKLASAGLIFAIVGGALMPPLQGRLIDLRDAEGMLWGLPAVNASFVLPLGCFVVIAGYALFAFAARRSVGRASDTGA
ncbi:MAG: MFS transporter [Planctomycetota bacterium]